MPYNTKISYTWKRGHKQLITTHNHSCKNQAQSKCSRMSYIPYDFTKQLYMKMRHIRVLITHKPLCRNCIQSTSHKKQVHMLTFYKNQLFSKMTYTRFLATHNSLCNNQTGGAAAMAATRGPSPPPDRITMLRNSSGSGMEPVAPAKTTNKQ